MALRKTRAQRAREAQLDALLAEMTDRVRAAGIPVSDAIDPHLRINRRAVNRLACCFEKDGVYTLELSGRAAEASDEAVRHLLVHELLHTVEGCGNHGTLWKRYALQAEAVLGYSVRRTVDSAEIGIPPRPPKYLLVCECCGARYPRMRRSPLTDHPEHYRCRCGGRLLRTNPNREVSQ